MRNNIENRMAIDSAWIKPEPRNVFAICEVCGEPIWGADSFYDGEEYVELTPDEYIHVDCINAWVKEHKKEAV